MAAIAPMFEPLGCRMAGPCPARRAGTIRHCNSTGNNRGPAKFHDESGGPIGNRRQVGNLPHIVTDSQLIARAASGDLTAFELLYERHGNAVYRYAWLLCRSVPDAEDITQESFLALIRKPAAPERAQLRTWLIAVARRQYLWRCRSSARETGSGGFEEAEAAGV